MGNIPQQLYPQEIRRCVEVPTQNGDVTKTAHKPAHGSYLPQLVQSYFIYTQAKKPFNSEGAWQVMELRKVTKDQITTTEIRALDRVIKTIIIKDNRYGQKKHQTQTR